MDARYKDMVKKYEEDPTEREYQITRRIKTK
jgi:hypothetical protein